MAKVRGAASDHGEVSGVKTVTMKVTPQYLAWLKSQARKEQRTVPALIENAIANDAIAKGYKGPVPKRTFR